MSVSKDLQLVVGNCAGVQSVQDAIVLLQRAEGLTDMLGYPEEDARWLVEGVKPRTTPPIPFAMAYLMAVNGRFRAANAVLAELGRALGATADAVDAALFQCVRERLRACRHDDIRAVAWIMHQTAHSVTRMHMFQQVSCDLLGAGAEGIAMLHTVACDSGLVYHDRSLLPVPLHPVAEAVLAEACGMPVCSSLLAYAAWKGAG
jgi:hypothetical protein